MVFFVPFRVQSLGLISSPGTVRADRVNITIVTIAYFGLWQIGFLLQEQVSINRTVFPYMMQKWDGLENIRNFNKTPLNITFSALFVSLLPFAAFDGISDSERHKCSAEQQKGEKKQEAFI